MSDLLKTPQYIIEGIILRRIYEKRIEGYTIETAKEIAEALRAAASAEPVADLRLCGLCHTWNSKPCGEQCGWMPNGPTVADVSKEPA